MDVRQNDNQESKRVDTWLTTKEVVSAIGGSTAETDEEIDDTAKPIVEKTKQKNLSAKLWYGFTIFADFIVAAAVFIFFSKSFPNSLQLAFVQLVLSFFLVYISEDIAYVAAKDLFANWGAIRRILLFLIVLAADALLLFSPPLIMGGLINASKIDDLYRIATINFTILTANCAIPAFILSKKVRREGVLSEYESKTYTQLIIFMIGAFSIASLLFAMFAKNDEASIALAGSFEYYYCFGSLLLSVCHFFLIFPRFDKAIGVMYDDAHPTKKSSDRKKD